MSLLCPKKKPTEQRRITKFNDRNNYKSSTLILLFDKTNNILLNITNVTTLLLLALPNLLKDGGIYFVDVKANEEQ
jgi:hypothetical protein